MSRIFIALPISPELQESIHQWQKRYSDLSVRWLAGENLHITLVPPWEEGDVESVITKLQSLANRVGSFTVHFDTAGFGPDPKAPRLIWATGPTPQELLYLKKDIEKILNYTPDRKTFLTHLTLARFNPADFINLTNVSFIKQVDWVEQINSFVVMESKLLPTGADYTVLAEIGL